MIFTKLRLALGAAIITAGLGLGAYAVWQARTAQELRVQASQYQHAIRSLTSALEASERAAAVSAQKRQAAQTRATQSTQELDRALSTDQAWAGSPIPDATAQWLRDNGFASEPTPAPAR